MYWQYAAEMPPRAVPFADWQCFVSLSSFHGITHPQGPATVSEKAKELIGVLRDLIAKNDACRKVHTSALMDRIQDHTNSSTWFLIDFSLFAQQGVPEIKEEFLRQRTKGDISV
jgi:hypothetical protein